MASKRPISAPANTPSTNTSGLPRGLVDRRGNPSAKGARLPSMRTPRDLTLGGVTKKTFVPNIPTRREKKDAKPTNNSSGCGENGGSGRVDRGRGRSRGRGRGQVIQSHSIFEEGPAHKQTKATIDVDHLCEGSDRSGGNRALSFSRIKTIKIESGIANTSKSLDRLLKDDFIDYSAIDSTLAPVKLPMSSVIDADLKMKTDLKVKEDEKLLVKMETEDGTTIEDITWSSCSTISDLINKVDNGNDHQLVFFQMPDVLPGYPKPPDDHEKQKGDKVDSTVLGKCLANFSPGKIGKLQFHKSGRVRLLIGNSAMDVNMGTPCSFLQDLVSINIKERQEDSLEPASGDIVVLEQVKHRLICTADFLSMMGTASRQNMGVPP